MQTCKFLRYHRFHRWSTSFHKSSILHLSISCSTVSGALAAMRFFILSSCWIQECWAVSSKQALGVKCVIGFHGIFMVTRRHSSATVEWNKTSSRLHSGCLESPNSSLERPNLSSWILADSNLFQTFQWVLASWWCSWPVLSRQQVTAPDTSRLPICCFKKPPSDFLVKNWWCEELTAATTETTVRTVACRSLTDHSRCACQPCANTSQEKKISQDQMLTDYPSINLQRPLNNGHMTGSKSVL